MKNRGSTRKSTRSRPKRSKRAATRVEAARALGVTPKTIDEWRGRETPAPHDVRDGHPVFDVEELRAWALAQGLGPGRERDTGVGREELRRAEAAAKGARAKRLALDARAEEGLGDLDLAERIRDAESREELLAMSREVGALVASGRLLPDRARALREVLAESRQLVREVEAARGSSQLERGLVCTDEVVPLVVAFEGIESPERRARVLRLVDAIAEEDRLERPVVDTGQPIAVDDDLPPLVDDGDDGALASP